MKVSVVIPTRNRAGRLPEAVRSALGQTIRDLEVLVVDDASEDATPQVLKELRGGDPRVRIIRCEERGGAARARNLGTSRAEGDLIAFLDDDCLWHPAKLEAQIAAMGPRYGAGYTRQATRDVDGRWVVEGQPLPEHAPLNALLRTNFIGNPSLVVRRDVFLEIGGFDEDLPRLQDWDLVLRLARTAGIAFVPEVLVWSVIIPGGISTTSHSLRTAAELMVERHGEHLSTAQLAALHYGLAKFLLVDGQTRVAVQFFLRAVRLDPVSPLNWMGLLAGLAGPRPARAVRSLRRWRAAVTAGGSAAAPTGAFHGSGGPR